MSQLTQAQRVSLMRFLGRLRPDWHHAGIDHALVKLTIEAPTLDPFTIATIAINAAANPHNRTPAVITEPARRRQASTPTTSSASTWCPEHGCDSTIRTDGQLACCHNDPIEPDQPYRRQPGVGPSPQARAQIETALASAKAAASHGAARPTADPMEPK